MPTHRHLLPPLAAIVAVAAIMAAPPAAPATHEPAAVREDTTWQAQPRDVSAFRTAEGFRFTSQAATDVIQGHFVASDAYIEFRYQPEDPPAPIQTLTWRAVALIEFVDADGNGRYDLGERVVQHVAVQAMEEPELTVKSFYEGHEVVISYEVPAEGSTWPLGQQPAPGRLDLSFLLTPVPRSHDGQVVHPTDAKIVIAINDFPFRQNNTALALHTHVASSHDLTKGSLEVVARQGLSGASLAWSEDVSTSKGPVAGRTTVFAAATHGDPGDAMEIVHAYPQDPRIEHDPTLTATRYQEVSFFDDLAQRLASGNPWLYAAGFLVAAGLIGVTVWRARS